jgi:pimeloyl-ACP methyl ester carboxylesterase
MKKVILAFLLLIGGVIVIAGCIKYQNWKRETEVTLQAGSILTHTEKGEIEFSISGEGPTIVILHGLKGGYDQGVVTSNLLNDKNFNIISVSRPGYLRTPLDTGTSFEEQADAVAALLDALNIDKAAVIGQSIGGSIAIQFALRYPERCWSLVLISAITMPKPVEPASMTEKLLSLLVDSDFGNWIMLTLVNTWPDKMIPLVIPDPKHLQIVLDDPVKKRSIIESAQSLALASKRKVGEENDIKQVSTMDQMPLKRIKTPSLIISGSGDDLKEDAINFNNQNPSSELILIEGGDHSTFTVFSDSLVPLVLEFLHSHVPTH